jgi:hypothetical protein
MSIIVETGIPIPAKAGRPAKYDFGKLKVSESFFAPVRPGTLRTCLRRARKKLGERQFVVRADGDGARCWRTA